MIDRAVVCFTMKFRKTFSAALALVLTVFLAPNACFAITLKEWIQKNGSHSEYLKRLEAGIEKLNARGAHLSAEMTDAAPPFLSGMQNLKILDAKGRPVLSAQYWIRRFEEKLINIASKDHSLAATLLAEASHNARSDFFGPKHEFAAIFEQALDSGAVFSLNPSVLNQNQLNQMIEKGKKIDMSVSYVEPTKLSLLLQFPADALGGSQTPLDTARPFKDLQGESPGAKTAKLHAYDILLSSKTAEIKISQASATAIVSDSGILISDSLSHGMQLAIHPAMERPTLSMGSFDAVDIFDEPLARSRGHLRLAESFLSALRPDSETYDVQLSGDDEYENPAKTPLLNRPFPARGCKDFLGYLRNISGKK